MVIQPRTGSSMAICNSPQGTPSTSAWRMSMWVTTKPLTRMRYWFCIIPSLNTLLARNFDDLFFQLTGLFLVPANRGSSPFVGGRLLRSRHRQLKYRFWKPSTFLAELANLGEGLTLDLLPLAHTALHVSTAAVKLGFDLNRLCAVLVDALSVRQSNLRLFIEERKAA